jgi:hypothetical protein
MVSLLILTPLTAPQSVIILSSSTALVSIITLPLNN